MSWEPVRRSWGGGGAEDGRGAPPFFRGPDYGFLFRLPLFVGGHMKLLTIGAELEGRASGRAGKSK